MINFSIAIINGLIWAVLRRVYGGAIRGGIFSKRGIQTVIMLVLMFPFLIPNFITNQPVAAVLAVLSSLYIQFVFWSRGHGPCFDMGTDKAPSIETIERYEKLIGFRFARKVIPYPRHYGYLFDFILMSIRYGLPLLPVALFYQSWGYALIGFLITPIYAICWDLYQQECWLFMSKFPYYLKKPIQMAEIISGFIFGFGIAILNPLM